MCICVCLPLSLIRYLQVVFDFVCCVRASIWCIISVVEVLIKFLLFCLFCLLLLISTHKADSLRSVSALETTHTYFDWLSVSSIVVAIIRKYRRVSKQFSESKAELHFENIEMQIRSQWKYKVKFRIPQWENDQVPIFIKKKNTIFVSIWLSFGFKEMLLSKKSILGTPYHKPHREEKLNW